MRAATTLKKVEPTPLTQDFRPRSSLSKPTTHLTAASTAIRPNAGRRDHLAEYYQKMSGFSFAKKPMSNYKDIHGYNDEFKTEMREKDYSHHFKQDFYTVYNEAYVVMKPHLRK